MNKTTHALLLFFTISFIFCACSKKESISNDEEFEGFVSATINKEIIRAEYKPILGDPLYNAYYQAEKNILFSRRINSQQTHGFRIEIKDVSLEQSIFPLLLNHSTKGNPRVNFAYIDENDSIWQMNIAAPMQFQLTLEKYQNNRISGTFGGTLYLSSIDSLPISEGKFEVELSLY